MADQSPSCHQLGGSKHRRSKRGATATTSTTTSNAVASSTAGSSVASLVQDLSNHQKHQVSSRQETCIKSSKKQTLTSASKRKASTESHGAPPSKVSSSTLLDASNADSSSGAQLIKNNRHKHEVCIPVTTLKSKRHNLPKKSKKTVELSKHNLLQSEDSVQNNVSGNESAHSRDSKQRRRGSTSSASSAWSSLSGGSSRFSLSDSTGSVCFAGSSFTSAALPTGELEGSEPSVSSDSKSGRVNINITSRSLRSYSRHHPYQFEALDYYSPRRLGLRTTTTLSTSFTKSLEEPKLNSVTFGEPQTKANDLTASATKAKSLTPSDQAGSKKAKGTVSKTAIQKTPVQAAAQAKRKSNKKLAKPATAKQSSSASASQPKARKQSSNHKATVKGG
eukprot:XP_011676002.1 PREDICTED: uncharacterized protein LOC105443981 [Strongylocentrotus purpuratus]